MNSMICPKTKLIANCGKIACDGDCNLGWGEDGSSLYQECDLCPMVENCDANEGIPPHNCPRNQRK
jgi:hypothetical protein